MADEARPLQEQRPILILTKWVFITFFLIGLILFVTNNYLTQQKHIGLLVITTLSIEGLLLEYLGGMLIFAFCGFMSACEGGKKLGYITGMTTVLLIFIIRLVLSGVLIPPLLPLLVYAAAAFLGAYRASPTRKQFNKPLFGLSTVMFIIGLFLFYSLFATEISTQRPGGLQQRMFEAWKTYSIPNFNYSIQTPESCNPVPDVVIDNEYNLCPESGVVIDVMIRSPGDHWYPSETDPYKIATGGGAYTTIENPVEIESKTTQVGEINFGIACWEYSGAVKLLRKCMASAFCDEDYVEITYIESPQDFVYDYFERTYNSFKC